MSKKFTAKEFRDLLDELSLTHKKTGDHTFRMPIPMDDDFVDSLGISFEVREKKIQAWAAIPGFGVENPRADSLEFCNLWNRRRVSPKVYVDKDGDFIAEQTIFIDEDFSDEFVKNNFIIFAASTIKNFFENLNLHLNTGTSPLEEDGEEILPTREKLEKMNELFCQLRAIDEDSKDGDKGERAEKRKEALDLINQMLEMGFGDLSDEDDEEEEEGEDDEEEEEEFGFNPFNMDDDERNPFLSFLRKLHEDFSSADEENESDDANPSEKTLDVLERLADRLRANGGSNKKEDGKRLDGGPDKKEDEENRRRDD